MTASVSDTSLDDGHMSGEAPVSSLMDTFLGLDTLVEKMGPEKMHWSFTLFVFEVFINTALNGPSKELKIHEIQDLFLSS